MTISADKNAAKATIDSLSYIRRELGCHTSLGVSNVSFGLPQRDAVNSTFFAMALGAGLSAAIMNPYSADMMKAYYAYKALAGLDDNCADYIAASEGFATTVVTDSKPATAFSADVVSELQRAIVKGFKDKAGVLTDELLINNAPLDIVNGEIIPALNTVGEGYEKGSIYLPQLLMSAEAAKSAFESIKRAVVSKGEGSESRGTVIIATVKGDIHDIGKNIVKLLLENYGFNVIDLGKDVAVEAIVEKATEINARLVALSALMTTTVPAMEETIKELRKCLPECKIMVGGAVLTEDYAAKVGADKYGKDAMEAVRYAESLFN